jgi:hypothetical protein
VYTKHIYYPLTNEVAKGYSNATVRPSCRPSFRKDYVCSEFGQNPLKDVDSRVFTRMLHGKTFTQWPMTLKINRFPDSTMQRSRGQGSKRLSMYQVFRRVWNLLIFKVKGQCDRVKFLLRNILVSRLFTRMLCGKNLTPWPLTLKINRVSDSPKDYICTKFGQNPLKDADSKVFTRMLRSKNLTRSHWPLTLKINRFQTLLKTWHLLSPHQRSCEGI